MKLKKMVEKWLGVDRIKAVCAENERRIKKLQDLSEIGVDVNLKSPSTIIIFSRLNGGQIKYIDSHFSSIKELNEFVSQLSQRFSIDKVTYDAPPGTWGRL